MGIQGFWAPGTLSLSVWEVQLRQGPRLPGQGVAAGKGCPGVAPGATRRAHWAAEDLGSPVSGPSKQGSVCFPCDGGQGGDLPLVQGAGTRGWSVG